MWHFLGQVKDMGFSGVNNFPTHSIVDGHFRNVLEETGMSFQKEVDMIGCPPKWIFSPLSMSPNQKKPLQMAAAGADAIIAHVGTTIGGSIGVVGATCTMDDAVARTQAIIDAVKPNYPDTFFLAHGGPINTPEDVRVILDRTDAHGFVGASSIERMGVEQSLTDLTKAFKSLNLS